MRAADLPWYDRSGAFSLFRLSVFLLAAAPLVWLVFEACAQTLGPRPATEAIHQTGLWAVRLLAATLAITPLRHATRLSKLAGVRRMLGLFVLFYALLHLLLYGVDQQGNLPHIASEIVRRIYLTVGFMAVCGLSVLGVTSTDAIIRRLGSRRWGALHKIVYAIAALAAVHFFMQSKLDKSEPIIMGGVYVLLIGERLARRLFGDLGVFRFAVVGLLSAVTTACAEAGWYSFKTGAPMLMILAANFDFSYTVRPVWFVLGAGAFLVAARLARPLFGGASRMAKAPPPVSAKRLAQGKAANPSIEQA